MKTTNYSEVEANTSHELRVKIGRDRIKRLTKPQDVLTMYSVEVPSLRLIYYCSNLERVATRIKAIRELYPDVEIFHYKPKKS